MGLQIIVICKVTSTVRKSTDLSEKDRHGFSGESI